MSDVSKALASITPKKREQLHISAVNMLEECGKRFEFRYVLGIRRPPAVFMHVGSAIDESVNKNLQYKIDHAELLKRSDAIEIASAKMDELADKQPIELDPGDKREGKTVKEVLGEAKDKSVALAGLHYDEPAQVIQATHVNRKFSIDMDTWLRKRAKQLHAEAEKETEKYRAKLLHSEAAALNSRSRGGMDLAGEIDVREEELLVMKPRSVRPSLFAAEQMPRKLIIRDTKTSGKSPTKSLMDGSDNPGIADDSDQLTTYALASLVLDNKLPDLMVLDYLVYTTKRHNTNYVPTKTIRDMNDINTFLNRFSNAVHAYHTGIFVPAKADWWGCSETYCGYWSMCPYAKRPKMVQIKKAVE